MRDMLFTFGVLALAVGCIAMTVARSGLFRSLRLWVDRKSAFLGELVGCPYCMSHWLAVGAMVVYRPRLVTSDVAAIDYLVTGFALVAVSSLVAGLIFRAFAHMAPPVPADEDDDG